MNEWRAWVIALWLASGPLARIGGLGLGALSTRWFADYSCEVFAEVLVCLSFDTGSYGIAIDCRG
jgi:hypothetical protein